MSSQDECPHMYCAVIEHGLIHVAQNPLDEGLWSQRVDLPVVIEVEWVQCQICSRKIELLEGELMIRKIFQVRKPNG